MATALIGGGVDDIRVGWMKFDVSDAGVLIDIENLLPGGTAVCCLEKTPVSTRCPQGTFRGDINHVAVARVDQDFPDVFGFFQAHGGPAFPCIETLVDTIAPAHVAAADIFTRADPNDVRIGRVDRNVGNGVGVLFVKNRCPGDAGVFGFPHPARAHGNIPGVAMLRVDFDIGNAAAHQGRAYAA